MTTDNTRIRGPFQYDADEPPARQVKGPEPDRDRMGAVAPSVPNQPGDVRQVVEHFDLRYEFIHHLPDCPSIGGNGDEDCRCGAVAFLKSLNALNDVSDKLADIEKLAHVLSLDDAVLHDARCESQEAERLRLFSAIATLRVEVLAAKSQPQLVQMVCDTAALNLARAEKAEADVESLRIEVANLRADLAKWIAFREGDTGVIERLQAFLETHKSNAATREEALYDRIRTREAEAKLTSPPAPSGWQQRIAAMDPRADDRNDGHCFFCGAWYRFDDDARLVCDPHKPDCLWQNAKDALPPQVADVNMPSGSSFPLLKYWQECPECGGTKIRGHRARGCTVTWELLPGEGDQRPVEGDAKDALPPSSSGEWEDSTRPYPQRFHEEDHPFLGALTHVAEVGLSVDGISATDEGEDALPPAPEGSPARFCECIGVAGHPNFVRTQHGRSVCVHCDLPRRADASPAKETPRVGVKR